MAIFEGTISAGPAPGGIQLTIIRKSAAQAMALMTLHTPHSGLAVSQHGLTFKLFLEVFALEVRIAIALLDAERRGDWFTAADTVAVRAG